MQSDFQNLIVAKSHQLLLFTSSCVLQGGLPESVLLATATHGDVTVGGRRESCFPLSFADKRGSCSWKTCTTATRFAERRNSIQEV